MSPGHPLAAACWRRPWRAARVLSSRDPLFAKCDAEPLRDLTVQRVSQGRVPQGHDQPPRGSCQRPPTRRRRRSEVAAQTRTTHREVQKAQPPRSRAVTPRRALLRPSGRLSRRHMMGLEDQQGNKKQWKVDAPSCSSWERSRKPALGPTPACWIHQGPETCWGGDTAAVLPDTRGALGGPSRAPHGTALPPRGRFPGSGDRVARGERLWHGRQSWRAVVMAGSAGLSSRGKGAHAGLCIGRPVLPRPHLSAPWVDMRRGGCPSASCRPRPGKPVPGREKQNFFPEKPNRRVEPRVSRWQLWGAVWAARR